MLPFMVEFKSGVPVSGQVVYAVKKAIVSGLLKPGELFPSVRILSQELRINPNTAHKAVMALTGEGLLAVKPGIGTVVASAPEPGRRARRAALSGDLERLVVEARKLGVGIEELIEDVRSQWQRFE